MTSARQLTATPPAALLRLRRAPALRSRSARGDAAAFTVLYERHHQELYRYCRAILRHDDDAQDALQSAMAKAFAALQEETRDFELRPWLFRIVHNEAISVMRRRGDATHLDAVPEAGDDSLPRTVADRQRLAELRGDLADLPERQRSALVLRELSGLGHEEIAEVLSSSPRAVKQVIFEARTALHECAEGRDMACADVQRALSDADGRVLRGRRIRAHLRSCRSCRAFRAALETRPADLRAIAAPLPAGAGAALLATLTSSGSATIAGSAGGAAAGGLGAGGAFAGLAAKAAVVAAVGAVAVGAATVDRAVTAPAADQRAPVTRSTQVSHARAGSGAATATAAGPGRPAAAGTPIRAHGATSLGQAGALGSTSAPPGAKHVPRGNGHGAAAAPGHLRAPGAKSAHGHGASSTHARGHGAKAAHAAARGRRAHGAGRAAQAHHNQAAAARHPAQARHVTPARPATPVHHATPARPAVPRRAASDPRHRATPKHPAAPARPRRASRAAPARHTSHAGHAHPAGGQAASAPAANANPNANLNAHGNGPK